MTYYDDDFYPVARITTAAVGDPGRRIFILQARWKGEIISWVIEKEQALALSRNIPKLLEDIREEFPELGDPLVAAEPNLELSEPLPARVPRRQHWPGLRPLARPGDFGAARRRYRRG